jgi:hypothetical protein
MNATHYRFTEAAAPVAEFRKTEARRMAGQVYRMGSLRHPLIDWQAWWRQAYRVLIQLLLFTRTILFSMCAFADEQLYNLKRFLMIMEVIVAEEFYEAMDSFFVMGTVAEIQLVAEPLQENKFVTSGERFLRYATAISKSVVPIFSLSYDFNKNLAKSDKPTTSNKSRSHDKMRPHVAKSPNCLFWKRWIGEAKGVVNLVIILRRVLNFHPKSAPPGICTNCLRC